MPTSRYNLSTLNVNGRIYAIGGDNEIVNGPMRAIERYDVNKNEWTRLAPMTQRRQNSAVTILDGKIYVIGGYKDRCLKSVECYDPILDEWTSVASMNQPRRGAQAGVAAGCLFVVGGHDGCSRICRIERYDREANVWLMVSFFLNL